MSSTPWSWDGRLCMGSVHDMGGGVVAMMKRDEEEQYMVGLASSPLIQTGVHRFTVTVKGGHSTAFLGACPPAIKESVTPKQEKE